jgi:hypothetical protein
MYHQRMLINKLMSYVIIDCQTLKHMHEMVQHFFVISRDHQNRYTVKAVWRIVQSEWESW